MAMVRWAIPMLLVCAVAATPADEAALDNLSLHVEHYPHSDGANNAIYQFQIDNLNHGDKPTGTVDFTAEVSPDMDVTNAYFYREKAGQQATKQGCKIGQRSPSSQEKIMKKFPGARITFPKIVKCKVHSIDEFATIYVHANVPDSKELPTNEIVKASYSQKGVPGKSVEISAIDPTQLTESF
eukprot:TRINITY_DN4604_c0_g1_i1.p1 TRINITY_DN4604_c0_g1~~TRINITY_DN4604_c0_g1_i1.p1  ORF type:complete len:183 (-),score=44.91 TRINITY_DN4604_c0_g1_i1:88-636(-)